MKVYISVDMEGVAGVATLDQIARGGFGYPRAQELMTAEANAAIQGAFDAGATEVLVNDSHGTMDNLLHERLDARARLIFGTPKLDCMAEGITADHDVALFIGYHAPAGGPGVLAHTFSAHFGQVRVNGRQVSEAEVNALQLAAVGVPLGLVVGDDVTASLVHREFPGTGTVVVKHSLGWSAANSVSPGQARALITAAAAEAVRNAEELTPPTLPDWLVLEVDLPNETAAELAEAIPGAERTAIRTIRREVSDPAELLGMITVLYQLSASAVAARQSMITRR
ncbi:M55 family metallopeptidase [Saxibacter everestensis]|uniref:M55 family metallopeptidase n=1 Tax=Saxibacter everestensis TaxID=2909229 RepID=A0ABY8QRH9_9MICO|nr:M55 family metallopeptidase [Brevibacteriaceae bacterium ZFBP1038]